MRLLRSSAEPPGRRFEIFTTFLSVLTNSFERVLDIETNMSNSGNIFFFLLIFHATSSDSAFKKWLVMYFPSLLLYNGLRNTNSQWVEHFHHQLLLLLHSHIQTTSDRNRRSGTGSRKQGSGNPPRSHHFSTANSKSYRDDSLTTSRLCFQSVFDTFSSTYSYWCSAAFKAFSFLYPLSVPKILERSIPTDQRSQHSESHTESPFWAQTLLELVAKWNPDDDHRDILP